jgi:hypothetical protein
LLVRFTVRLPRKAAANDNGRVVVRRPNGISDRLHRALVRRGLVDLTLGDVSRLGDGALVRIALSPLWTGLN